MNNRFLGSAPAGMEDDRVRQQPNYIQSAPMAQQGPPGLGTQLASMVAGQAVNEGVKVATPMITNAIMGTAAPAVTTGLATGGAAAAGAGAAGAGLMGAMGPIAAAMGPIGIGLLGAKAFGLFNKGTPNVPYNYADGTPHVAGPLGMNADVTPAMLTPGEAVIPVGAAQNPQNQPMIQAMIDEGNGAEEAMESGMMAGPLSGKAKREIAKAGLDLTLKTKAFQEEQRRKEELHQLKMQQTRTQQALKAKQSGE